MLFPGRKIPILVGPKQISVVSKVKQKKIKIVTFPPSICLFYPIFPFFLTSLFPVGQKKIPGQKSLGVPPACYATVRECTCLYKVILLNYFSHFLITGERQENLLHKVYLHVFCLPSELFFFKTGKALKCKSYQLIKDGYSLYEY